MRDGTHAVVLGASMAGLTHAVALADRFDRVTIVERDRLPSDAVPRAGVPQGRHVHLLLPGGLQRLEALLPGVSGALVNAGAQVIGAPEWRMHLRGGRLRLTDPSVRIAGATRPLLESVVRRQVLARPSVELLDGWAARSLTATEDGRVVTGVRLRPEGGSELERVLSADLVVDTTGRGSSAPRWLRELGYDAPQEERLNVGVHYATRLFRPRPDALDGCRHVLVDIPIGGLRGGLAMAVEDGPWLVTLVGMFGERPPTDLDGFVGYARSLWADDVHSLIAEAEPVGDGHAHAFPAYLRRRYDRLRTLPERFVVSGDAVCSLNPSLGQGMTVAISEAVALGEVLDRHGLTRVGSRLLRCARPVVDDAWALSTGSDLAHAALEGPRPLSRRLVNAYLGRVFPAAHADPEVAAALVRVLGMLDRPPQLMRPKVLARVGQARNTSKGNEDGHRRSTGRPAGAADGRRRGSDRVDGAGADRSPARALPSDGRRRTAHSRRAG